MIRSFSLLATALVAIGPIAPHARAEERAPLFREVGDFRPLDDFESVEAFQAEIDQYQKECRDAWISSSMGSRCGVEADLWDRELNAAYAALMGVLNDDDAKEKLRSAQRSWITSRDETLAFAKRVLDLHYDTGERMWIPILSLKYTETLAALTKERTLTLRGWKRDVENPVSNF